jgi:hypothetical protein
MNATACNPGVSTGTGLGIGYELSPMPAFARMVHAKSIKRSEHRSIGMNMNFSSFVSYVLMGRICRSKPVCALFTCFKKMPAAAVLLNADVCIVFVHTYSSSVELFHPNLVHIYVLEPITRKRQNPYQ